MLGVLAQLADDVVVVAVRGLAERLLAFQHDHHRAVGVELVEVVAHPHHRLHRRRVQGRHRRRMRLADDFQLRDGDVHDDGHDDPAQDDRDREDADDVRDERAVAVPARALGCRGAGRVEALLVTIASRAVAGAGHADFTRQKVWALMAVGALMLADDAVDGDAAADVAAVGLRHDVGADRGQRGGEGVRPRQRRAVDLVRVGVGVPVVDDSRCCRAARRPRTSRPLG